MAMNKIGKSEIISSLLKKYTLFNLDEAERAIEFVEEMLELEIEYTKQTEPYAKNSIREMDAAKQRVRDLLDVTYEKRSM